MKVDSILSLVFLVLFSVSVVAKDVPDGQDQDHKSPAAAKSQSKGETSRPSAEEVTTAQELAIDLANKEAAKAYFAIVAAIEENDALKEQLKGYFLDQTTSFGKMGEYLTSSGNHLLEVGTMTAFAAFALAYSPAIDAAIIEKARVDFGEKIPVALAQKIAGLAKRQIKSGPKMAEAFVYFIRKHNLVALGLGLTAVGSGSAVSGRSSLGFTGGGELSPTDKKRLKAHLDRNIRPEFEVLESAMGWSEREKSRFWSAVNKWYTENLVRSIERDQVKVRPPEVNLDTLMKIIVDTKGLYKDGDAAKIRAIRAVQSASAEADKLQNRLRNETSNKAFRKESESPDLKSSIQQILRMVMVLESIEADPKTSEKAKTQVRDTLKQAKGTLSLIEGIIGTPIKLEPGAPPPLRADDTSENEVVTPPAADVPAQDDD